MAGPVESLGAIVVGRVDYGEADRIVRLLTAEHGRIAVMARAARKSSRRFGGALDLGNRVEIQVARGRGDLWSLRACRLVQGHAHVRSDLDRMALVAYACELCASLAREHHPEPRLFGLLEVALLVLDAATVAPSDVWRWGLEAKALTFAGLTPRLGTCGVSGEPLAGRMAVYDLATGGVVLPEHGQGTPVPSAWAAQVEAARRTPLAELIDVPPEPGPVWQLYDHLRWHTQRDLRSKRMLVDLRSRDGGR